MNNDRRKRVLDAYRAVFSHPLAGIVLMDLAEEAQFFRPSFRNVNPEGTAYGEGKRSLLLRIFQFSECEVKIRDAINKTWRTEDGRTE